MSTETNKHGSTIKRSFDCNGSRYQFDAHCTPKKGWAQYDTDQDASYYGVWVNKGERKILSFAEGDITLVEAPTAEVFAAEMKSLADFHGPPPPAFICIDADGTRTDVYDTDAAHGRPLPA